LLPQPAIPCDGLHAPILKLRQEISKNYLT
jgi:hypothetical protein